MLPTSSEKNAIEASVRLEKVRMEREAAQTKYQDDSSSTARIKKGGGVHRRRTELVAKQRQMVEAAAAGQVASTDGVGVSGACSNYRVDMADATFGDGPNPRTRQPAKRVQMYPDACF